MSLIPPPAGFEPVAKQGEHLLPPNATPLEQALSAVEERLLQAPVWVIRAVWDADRCPVHLLPYLASAWSVDEWDPQWSEADKRQAIRDSVWLHQHKGTVGAMKRALAQLKLTVSVSEWFQHGGDPYTFRLKVALAKGATWTSAQAAQLYRVAMAHKNVRSFLDEVRVSVPPQDDALVRTGVAIVMRVAVRPILEPVTAIAAPRDYVRIGAVIKMRARLVCAPIGA